MSQYIHLLGHIDIMLKLLALLLGITQAFAQGGSGGYLIFSSQALCLTRSQQMCAAMGCDGTLTKYWWDCSTALQSGTVGANAVTAGSFAMRIDSGQFGPTASNNVSGGTQGLTAQEQSSLVSPATANGSTVFPWVISIVTFDTRLTPSVVSALNSTVDTTLASEWTQVKGAAVVNLQTANTIAMVNQAVTDGIIQQSAVQGILAPSITAVPPL